MSSSLLAAPLSSHNTPRISRHRTQNLAQSTVAYELVAVHAVNMRIACSFNAMV